MIRSRSGFTLLEVLMALGIFTLIGIATVRQINQIQTTKDAAFEDLDAYNSLRSALSMLRNDLSQSFHILYSDLSAETRAAVQQGEQTAHTLFDGRKKELVFTSLSHRNFYSDRRETDQTEISYFLQTKQGSNLSVLMKRESEMIDNDLYQGGSLYSLIEGVENLEFQFWDEKTGKWLDDWNSDAGATRDRFPLGLRVKMTVLSKAKRPVTAHTTIKVANPNNDAFVVQFQ